ncbi:unnamed protein product [Chondrus crispus]|uniref:Uncharacterized protein n=1 Tax=Chondrus crispus TaxID=2769 RepID=R7QLP3_CHOCR|nr:unnamed protein product [Chondrus crispus]CDF38396.1 unnamed protein product [Chondrus crispus]|eukprot:XP_005718289.1 unnamed protein product [Chondrus crispus]
MDTLNLIHFISTVQCSLLLYPTRHKTISAGDFESPPLNLRPEQRASFRKTKSILRFTSKSALIGTLSSLTKHFSSESGAKGKSLIFAGTHRLDFTVYSRWNRSLLLPRGRLYIARRL